MAEGWKRARAAARASRASNPYPTHRLSGSNSERQSIGLPGHCERCAKVGHVKAHPRLGCGDVGCDLAHGPEA
jgi:hypothetical protein